MQTVSLEIWADSFHEGEWCCDRLGDICESLGGKYHVEYQNGFIPKYVFSTSSYQMTITVYGSYKSWAPIPKRIKNLIAWGKPDFIAYDPEKDEILFAVEETAAVPTGNQALQRCERIYGSAKERIPFFYLLSEFGRHKDKGIRRSSIWPSVMSIKLSYIHRTPCVVLFYSDEEHPEDYNYGIGVDMMFKMLFQLLDNHAQRKPKFYKMDDIYRQAYRNMIGFVNSQWREQINFLPGEETDPVKLDELATVLTNFAINGEDDLTKLPSSYLVWPNVDGLPDQVRQSQMGKPLIKPDRLCELLEQDLTRGKAYSLSDNAGSRPQAVSSIHKWIKEQEALFYSESIPNGAVFSLKVEDFPSSRKVEVDFGEEDILEGVTDELGLEDEEVEEDLDVEVGLNDNPQGTENPEDKDYRHVTTSKNIVYLYDRWADLKAAIGTAYPRLQEPLKTIGNDEMPVMIYISNSLKKGRIFGDPFTGQLSAYATIFGKDVRKKRMVIAYYPHQVHTQYLKGGSNKGKVLLSDVTDYLLFTGGVLVQSQTKEVY